MCIYLYIMKATTEPRKLNVSITNRNWGVVTKDAQDSRTPWIHQLTVFASMEASLGWVPASLAKWIVTFIACAACAWTHGNPIPIWNVPLETLVKRIGMYRSCELRCGAYALGARPCKNSRCFTAASRSRTVWVHPSYPPRSSRPE